MVKTNRVRKREARFEQSLRRTLEISKMIDTCVPKLLGFTTDYESF
jgi:hypothetical protein